MENGERITRSSIRSKLRLSASSVVVASTPATSRKNATIVPTPSSKPTRASKVTVQRARPALAVSSNNQTIRVVRTNIAAKPPDSTSIAAKRRVAPISATSSTRSAFSDNFVFKSAIHIVAGEPAPIKERRINVGDKFQARTAGIEPRARPSNSPDRDVCVWRYEKNAAQKDDAARTRDFCTWAHSALNMSADRV